MNEIRSWMDSRKIQPAAFNSETKMAEAVTFEIHTRDEARLFEQTFT
jgi:hypothetical protein